MSTKAIREALSYYERHVTPGSYGEALVGEAREELEAIEKAALVLNEKLALQMFAPNPDEVEEALNLMGRISTQ